MKLKDFQNRLKKKKIDAALFLSTEIVDPAMVYLTGLEHPQHSVLIVPAKGKAIFFVNALDYERAKQNSMISVKLLEKKLVDVLKEKFPKLKKIGLHQQWVPASIYLRWKKQLQVKFVDVTPLVEEVRLIKTVQEIKYLKKAAGIADKAFSLMLQNFRYKTETDIAASLEYHMKKQGSSTAFPTIVASEKNASKPHHVTSNTKLKRGFCVIDFGAIYKNYRSDMTRTIFLGKPTSKEKEMYKKLLDAQLQGIKTAKVDVSCKDVDNASRLSLGVYKKYFIHSLGHGVGVEVHEKPSLSSRSKDVLQKGMVFTIEPGIYISGKFGIRIEDMIVLGKKKEVITKTSKKLIIREKF